MRHTFKEPQLSEQSFGNLKALLITVSSFAIISILAFSTFTSCAPVERPSSISINLRLPSQGLVGSEIPIVVEVLEPGVSSVNITIEGEADSRAFQLRRAPYSLLWIPTRAGIYSVKVRAYSIVTGSTLTGEGTITIFDTNPPKIESATMIPGAPYAGDEVLLQLKVGSANPFVILSASGKVTDAATNALNWTETEMRTKPGFIYLRLPRTPARGQGELLVRATTPFSEDATKIIVPIREIDRQLPEIFYEGRTFYSTEGNLIFTLRFTDNDELRYYRILWNGETIEEATITGRTFTKTYNLGRRELGAHSLNVEVRDREGNVRTMPKIVYVGTVALSFNIALSPSAPTAESSAIITVVPEERDIFFTKIVFFVDGNVLAINESLSATQSANLFTIWNVEEGSHVITVYAESRDRRAGIAELYVDVDDYSPPRFVSLTANDVVLSKTEFNQVFPGLVTFKLTVFDKGGINTGVKPRLLIKENEFEGLYRDLQMEVEDVSPDGKRARFIATTPMALGYYYVTVINVQDRRGNVMRDIGNFLLYVQ